MKEKSQKAPPASVAAPAPAAARTAGKRERCAAAVEAAAKASTEAGSSIDTPGRPGTATAAGLLYSAAAVADRAVRLIARGHALFANAFLLFAALATASSFVEMPAFLLAWHVTHELLVEAAVTFGVLAYGVEAVWSATFAPMAASANGLVCVVAGVTTNGFAAAGAEAVALAERDRVAVDEPDGDT